MKRKVAIVGAGFVGSTTAYTLMQKGLAEELVLIDINKEKAEGEVMDLNHGMAFVKPVKIYSGSYSDVKGADIIILTAGANQKVGETRIDLVKKNSEIFKSIVSEIVKYNKDAILLVVTNPVDILTYVTFKVSGFDRHKVIGSGTVLDTARFKYLISQHINLDVRNVHAYILGEHGDSEFPAWSSAHVAGIKMDDYCKQCKSCNAKEHREEIFRKVKNAAYEIIEKKQATYYAVALGVSRIVEAIYRDENTILTISTVHSKDLNSYGLDNVALSLPTIVGKEGAREIISMNLNKIEQSALKNSEDTLQSIIRHIRL